MIAVAIILATVILGQTGLSVFLAISYARTSGQLADAKALAAQRTGEASLSADRVAQANQATETAVAAEKTQEHRADVLEADASATSSDPASAIGQLSALSTKIEK